MLMLPNKGVWDWSWASQSILIVFYTILDTKEKGKIYARER